MSPELHDNSTSSGDGCGESQDDNSDDRNSCSDENGNDESDDDGSSGYAQQQLAMLQHAVCTMESNMLVVILCFS